jgi:hypothetical protein
VSRGWAGRCAVCIVSVVVLAAGAGTGVWESGAQAAVDPSLCSATSSRLTVPAGYPLGACWDGADLTINNSSAFVLDLTAAGATETGTRSTSNAEAAGAVFADLHSSPSVLPPGYQETVPFGSGGGTVTFSGDKGNETYAEYRALATILPGRIFADYQAVAAFVDSLSTARSNFDQCRQGANFLSAAGCAVALVTSVSEAAAALAASGGAQLGPGSLGELMALVQTAAWANDAVTDLGSLIDAPKTVTIAAATPVPVATTTTTTTTSPPANDISGFVGSWYVHGGGLQVNADGTAQLTFQIYSQTGGSPTFPTLDLTLSGSGTTATATVTSSTDPTVAVGSTFTLTLAPPGVVLSNTPGDMSQNVSRFCDQANAQQDACGA